MYEECPHGMPYDRRCVHCERGEPESMSMTTDLKKLTERINAAIDRITSGHALMRVPVDQTDPDVVLADCLNVVQEVETLRSKLARHEEAAPTSEHRCGACQRGEHTNCSGWCFCPCTANHSAVPQRALPSGVPRNLVQGALNIFEQAYPRPVPHATEHNNPVFEWMGKAREYLAATPQPAPQETKP